MPKAGELGYLRMIGEEAARGAYNKPFADDYCGQHLIALGTLRTLLPPPPARLLELGCGTGWMSCLFAKMGYDVVGQDVAPDMIQYAQANKQRYQTENVRFVVCDYEEMDFSAEFDCAVFYDSLHHSVDERKALEMVYRALRDGGVCVTHEPGEGHAQSDDSRRAREEYGVTENDMPPHRIIALASAVGFRNYRCYPHPELVIDGVIRSTVDAQTWKGLSPSKRLWRLLRMRLRRARLVPRAFSHMDNGGGLVVLHK